MVTYSNEYKDNLNWGLGKKRTFHYQISNYAFILLGDFLVIRLQAVKAEDTIT